VKVREVSLGRIHFFLLAFLITSLNLSEAFASARLARLPFIQRPTSSSATIVWETDVATSCSIEFGLTLDLDSRIRSRGQETRHVVELTGLKANATYYYRILGAGAPLMEVSTFQTNKDRYHPDISFVVFGDSGTGGQNQLDIAIQMLRVKPDFGLITGDIVYPSGAAEDYDKKYFSPYSDIISSVCFYPTMGNHDYRTSKGKPYLDAFVLPENNPAGTEKYYSFDYGNAHFVCIDSNLPIGGQEEIAQFEWLRMDLSSTKSLWKFVFLHHPPYSSSHRGSEMPIRERYCPLFEEYSVDIVFCGHDHCYERTIRINDFFPSKDGVIYIVTGGGGARLYNVGHNEWTAFAKKAYHFLHVNIKGRTLKLRAIDKKGKEFDTLLLDKRVARTSRAVPGLLILILSVAGAMIFRRKKQ
jgi:hypothetical protein